MTLGSRKPRVLVLLIIAAVVAALFANSASAYVDRGNETAKPGDAKERAPQPAPDKAGKKKSKDLPRTVELQILAINDFHGNIATTDDFGPDETIVGRADFLAAHIRDAEAGVRHSTMVLSLIHI